jgi:DNA-binding winged helix-turn-helix (wHTH) protein/Tfp pilus assembly protein PilF
MSTSGEQFYEFGDFRIDVANRLLFHEGQASALAPKTVETLIALVRSKGEVLNKDELLKTIWPDRVVEEGNLTQNIYLLRKTLGKAPDGKDYIETVPRRGYRFTGELRAATTEVSRTNSSEQSRVRVSKSRWLWLAGVVLMVSGITGYFALSRTVKSSSAKPTSEAYKKGLYFAGKGTTSALEQSIQQFDEALRTDPDSALTYAGVSQSYAALSSHYDTQALAPNEALQKAKAAATKAVELDDSLAESHTALAVVNQRYDLDWSAAEKQFKRAIELNPMYAIAHQEYASLLAATGRTAEGKSELLRAQQLDQHSLSIAKDIGEILLYERKYDKASEQFRSVIEIDPTDPQAVATRRALGWTYELRGMHEQALTEFIEASRAQNAGPERLSAFRRAFDEGGMKGYWRAWLQLQSDRIERGRINPAALAQVYAFLGDTEQAFKALEQAFNDHTLDVAALQLSPVFDALRTDARYETLMRRLGFKTLQK